MFVLANFCGIIGSLLAVLEGKMGISGHNEVVILAILNFFVYAGIPYGYVRVHRVVSEFTVGCFMSIVLWIVLFGFEISIGMAFGWFFYLKDWYNLFQKMGNMKNENRKTQINSVYEEEKTEKELSEISEDAKRRALEKINAYKDLF